MIRSKMSAMTTHSRYVKSKLPQNKLIYEQRTMQIKWNDTKIK